MLSMFRQLWKDEEGATALEYAILVALIALIIVVGVGTFGTELNAFFEGLAGSVPLGGGGGAGT